MKKFLFFIFLIGLFFVVMSLARHTEIGGCIKGEEGIDVAIAGLLAVLASVWTSLGHIRNSVFIWALTSTLMVMLFGVAATVAFLVGACITRVWVRTSPEIKDIIKLPLEPEE